MMTRVRAVLAGGLLVGLVAALGCGGGNGGFRPAANWDYSVTMFTDLGTCGPNLSMQGLEGDVVRNGSFVTVKIRMPEGNGCDEYVWTLNGSLLSGETWNMNDVGSTVLCRFQQDHAYGQFTLDHGQMELFTDMSYFNYAANINVNVGGGACLGLLNIQGRR